MLEMVMLMKDAWYADDKWQRFRFAQNEDLKAIKKYATA